QGLLLRAHADWLAVDEALAPATAPKLGAKDALATLTSPLWRRRKVLAGVATAVAAGGVGKAPLFDSGVYKTKVGEIRRVPLSDGSAVTVNSSTDLKVRMEKRSRQIELERGEAWFEVAKDAKRPFVVIAGRVKARAIGTAFSVRRREAGVEVMVT